MKDKMTILARGGTLDKVVAILLGNDYEIACHRDGAVTFVVPESKQIVSQSKPRSANVSLSRGRRNNKDLCNEYT